MWRSTTCGASRKQWRKCAGHSLDILHAHYAVPHAIAAIRARLMLPPTQRPYVVTTLHGRDATLLGLDVGWVRPSRNALERSDAVTAVSGHLAQAARRVLAVQQPCGAIRCGIAPYRLICLLTAAKSTICAPRRAVPDCGRAVRTRTCGTSRRAPIAPTPGRNR